MNKLVLLLHLDLVSHSKQVLILLFKFFKLLVNKVRLSRTFWLNERFYLVSCEWQRAGSYYYLSKWDSKFTLFKKSLELHEKETVRDVKS